MTCPSCRTSQPPGARFCTRCGLALETPPGISSGTRRSRAAARAADRSAAAVDAVLRQLGEGFRHAVWVADATDEQILYVSPALEQLLGRPRAGLYADRQSWRDAIHPEDRERVEQALARTRDPQQMGAGERVRYRVIRPDHTVRWVDARFSVIYDTRGSTRRLVGIAEDVTEDERARAVLLRVSGYLRDRADLLARLEEHQRQTARLQDRCVQSLFGALARIRGLDEAGDASPPGRLRLSELSDQLSEIIGALRDASSERRVPALSEPELRVGLAVLAAELRTVGIHEVSLIVDDFAAASLSRAQVNAVLEVAHEAVADIERRATASRVTMTLAATPTHSVFTVADDGTPARDAAAADEPEVLAREMLAKIERLGGRVMVQKLPGSDRVVTLELPHATALHAPLVAAEWKDRSASYLSRANRLTRRLHDLLQNTAGDTVVETSQASTLRGLLEELHASLDEMADQFDTLVSDEARIGAARLRYETLFELSPDPFVVTDLRGRIEDLNMAAAELLNMPRQWLVGRPLSMFVDPVARRAFEQAQETLAQTGVTQQWLTRIRPRGGDPIEVATQASQIPAPRGESRGVRWLLRDAAAMRQRDDGLADLLRDQGRLEGVLLAAREASHLLNNDLQAPLGALDLLVNHHAAALPPHLLPLLADALLSLESARQHLRQFPRVTHVTVRETPAGPALDLARSTAREPADQ